MAYSEALNKAWDSITGLAGDKQFKVGFLSDVYNVDAENITITSVSTGAPARDYINIIILHYLAKKLSSGIPEPSGEWVSFAQIEGGEGYYPAFKNRVIDRISKKYGFAADKLLDAAGRLPAKKTTSGDVGIVVDALERVPIMITMWKADEEFGPSANVLFDKTISGIFCTEDIVVLAEILAHSL